MVDEQETQEVEMDDDEEDDTPVRPSRPTAGEPTTGLLGSAWKAQHSIERWWGSLSKGRFARVLKMARKPEPEEFRQSSTVVLVGIAVIGFIGFMTYIVVRGLLSALNIT